MNKTFSIGRLTSDPTLKYSSSGTAMGSFTLAVDRPKFGDKEKETDFLSVKLWGKTAENCANQLGKGRLVCVEGSMRVDKWEKDGEKKSFTYINAERVQFLDWKKDAEQRQPGEDPPNFDDDGSDIPF